MRSKKHLPKTFLVSLIAGGVFFLYVLGLIYFLYSTYNQLEQVSRSRFFARTQNNARLLNYFFLERCKDLLTLSQDSQILAYFINKQLGMSKELGLKKNIHQIKTKLQNTYHQTRFNNNTPIYSALAVFEANGYPVSQILNNIQLSKYLSRNHKEHFVHIVPYSNNSRILLFTPCYIRSHYVGWIAALIEWKQIFSHFLNIDNQGKQEGQKLFLIADSKNRLLFSKKTFQFPHSNLQIETLLLSKIRLQKVETRKLQLAGTGERVMISNSYNRHIARYRCSPVPARKNSLFAGESSNLDLSSVFWNTISTDETTWLAIWQKIENTPFFFITSINESSITEIKHKNFLFASLLIICLGISIGIIFILKSYTKQAIAEARYRESEYLRQKAEELAKAKSDFLANMSHEIRTPLNGIIGMLDILVDTELSEKQKEYINTAIRSGKHLMEIINNILDFSKLDAGQIKLEHIEFNIRQLVEDVTEMFAEASEKKQIELACFIEAGVPELTKGDPVRIRQILINLIGNAIKFTRQGGVYVKVKPLEEKGDDKIKLYFEVQDTGIGIPEHAQSKLFEPFEQADTSTTRHFGGTGLGLAICKQLIELMGGEINVQSKPGQGSKFFFTLVLSKTQAQEISVPKDLQGLSVLIVDDNSTNRQILEHYISSWNMNPDTAATAKDAITKLLTAFKQNNPFKIAILDYMMPDEDGIELARKIKSHKELSKTRLILLTSLLRKEQASLTKEAGFDGYLTKPVRQSHLYDCLVMVMGKQENKDNLITIHSIQAKQFSSKTKILLVEDNPVNQKVASILLKKMGLSVDIANNGLEAIEAVQQKNYDLILMDCQMPEMDGFEATRQIREMEKKGQIKKLPIIAMTANAMEGDREECLAAGMDEYLTKPVNKDKLKEMLKKFLTNVA